MPSLSSESVRAYRAIGVFVGAALVAFVVLFRQDGTPDTQALVGLWLVAAAAGALVAATFSGPAVHRYLRTSTYLLFLLTIGVINWLAFQSAYDVPYAVGLMFMISALGLGGGVASRTGGWMGVCIGAAVALPILGLVATPDPNVDPLLYGLALFANGLSVYWIVWTRIEMRTSLEDERERYQNLFDLAAEGIYLADAETLQILDANPAYLELSGWTLEEIRELRIPDLVSQEPGAFNVEKVAESISRPKSTFAGSHRHVTASGEPVDVDVSVSTLTYDGRPAFSVMVRNATVQRETERRLEDARERAEQLNNLKSALLSTMRHEVRTPLTGILGYAELLRHALDGEPLTFTEAITESAERLHETLESVLDLAEVESGTFSLDPEDVDVVPDVLAVADEVTAEASAKGLRVEVRTPSTPVVATIDRSAFRRVLRHVLTNAVKFTESGGVLVEMEARDGRARVRVSDTGIGIPESFQSQLFESFRQASTGVTRTHQGTGLGLAIAHRLATAMGGTIEVESEEGVGSVFTVSVPASPEARAEPPGPDLVPHGSRSPDAPSRPAGESGPSGESRRMTA